MGVIRGKWNIATGEAIIVDVAINGKLKSYIFIKNKYSISLYIGRVQTNFTLINYSDNEFIFRNNPPKKSSPQNGFITIRLNTRAVMDLRLSGPEVIPYTIDKVYLCPSAPYFIYVKLRSYHGIYNSFIATAGDSLILSQDTSGKPFVISSITVVDDNVTITDDEGASIQYKINSNKTIDAKFKLLPKQKRAE